MDYELGEETVKGLDLLKQLGIKNAYLVTNHAEHCWMQKLIADTSYYLLPKSLLNKIKIIF